MKHVPFEEGCAYHIYNRGNNKENIFIEERNYEFFLQKVRKYLLEVADIYAYSLLPNHFHLVLKIKGDDELPAKYQTGKAMLHQPFSNLFNSYTKSINKVYDRSGSLFQEHLHRNKIDSEEYLKDVIIYTLLNPVTHGFVTDYSKYEFTSFASLFSEEFYLISAGQVIELFDDQENLLHCLSTRKYINENRLDTLED